MFWTCIEINRGNYTTDYGHKLKILQIQFYKVLREENTYIDRNSESL